jgi:hypothetical protein
VLWNLYGNWEYDSGWKLQPLPSDKFIQPIA